MFLYQRMRWGESPGEGGVRSQGIATCGGGAGGGVVVLVVVLMVVVMVVLMVVVMVVVMLVMVGQDLGG